MSRRTRLALMGLGLVVIVVFCWFALLNPVRGDISSTKASIETQRTRLRRRRGEACSVRDHSRRGREEPGETAGAREDGA